MSFGIAAISRPGNCRPRDIARACEERGFDLLLFPDHSHIPDGPSSRRLSGPLVGRDYIDMYESIVATTEALEATDRLRVGPGVAVLSQRDPIYFAKQITSLAVLSNGRAVVGVGAGWNRRELRNHGVEHGRRFEILDSNLRVACGLLNGSLEACKEAMDVSGAIGNVSDVFGPLRIPAPQILIGGDGSRTLSLIARHGTGWMPNGRDPHKLAQRIRMVRCGKYPGIRPDISILVFAAPMDAAVLGELIEAGASGIIFRIADDSRDENLAAVSRLEKLIQRLAIR